MKSVTLVDSNNRPWMLVYENNRAVLVGTDNTTYHKHDTLIVFDTPLTAKEHVNNNLYLTTISDITAPVLKLWNEQP